MLEKVGMFLGGFFIWIHIKHFLTETAHMFLFLWFLLIFDFLVTTYFQMSVAIGFYDCISYDILCIPNVFCWCLLSLCFFRWRSWLSTIHLLDDPFFVPGA